MIKLRLTARVSHWPRDVEVGIGLLMELKATGSVGDGRGGPSTQVARMGLYSMCSMGILARVSLLEVATWG